MDRLGIITEQAPPYAPSAKGTVESLFRWMTQRFERRQANTSHGINDAKAAAEAGGMTLEEKEAAWEKRQREDIHPAEVLERLASIESKKAKGTPSPKAVPDANPDRPVRTLRIRTIREEPIP